MNINRQPIVYLILKRMRTPLILLIVVWTLSIVGLTQIPGVEIDGEPRYLTIFEAFYFVSYMATTIGFGEPYFGFTDTQRLWVTFTLYLTVVSWFFAIGNIISLLQDPALRTVWRRQRFAKQTARISEKFFIICGYGETGEMLLQHLADKGYQCVVIDNTLERINLLDLDSSVYNVPYLLGDAGDVETLRMAGIENDNCRAVLAVTNSDNVNVKVAVTAKLLRSNVKVICRANSKEAAVNAKSFDTDHVINPHRTYAESFSRAFRTPSIYQLTLSLLRRSGRNYVPPLNLPKKGHWIICGYDEFGQEMARYLEYEGMDYSIISNAPDLTAPHIKGRGTEAVTLRAAGIDNAVGIIAATSDDTDNFSVIMTARHLKPTLFLLARQNQESNRLIFQNAEIDAIMESSRLVMWTILPLITQPKLSTFLRLARHQDEAWGQAVLAQLKALSDTVPASYLLKINERKSPALMAHLASGNILRLQDLFIKDKNQDKTEDAGSADQPVALPLMLIRDGKEELLPKLSTAIKNGDIYLIASNEKVRDQVLYTLTHEQDFYYMIHGEEKPVSIVMSLLKKHWKEHKTRRRQQKKAKAQAQKQQLQLAQQKGQQEQQPPQTQQPAVAVSSDSLNHTKKET